MSSIFTSFRRSLFPFFLASSAVLLTSCGGSSTDKKLTFTQEELESSIWVNSTFTKDYEYIEDVGPVIKFNERVGEVYQKLSDTEVVESPVEWNISSTGKIQFKFNDGDNLCNVQKEYEDEKEIDTTVICEGEDDVRNDTWLKAQAINMIDIYGEDITLFDMDDEFRVLNFNEEGFVGIGHVEDEELIVDVHPFSIESDKALSVTLASGEGKEMFYLIEGTMKSGILLNIATDSTGVVRYIAYFCR